MMHSKRNTWGACLAALVMVGSASAATDLELKLESGGSSYLSVMPGATVNYELSGELLDNGNQGLAMFAVDVVFDGGSLSPASPGLGMGAFVAPMGLNNPAGFGGTPNGSSLLQLGGAQNTIANTFASAPLGTVATGIALPGFPTILATGSLIAPTQPGLYTLSLENRFCQCGERWEPPRACPFGRYRPQVIGTLTELTIHRRRTALYHADPATEPDKLAWAAQPQIAWAGAGNASFSGNEFP